MGGKTVPFSPKKQRQTICLHCEKKETVQTCPIVLSWPDQESGVNGQHVHKPATTRRNINRSRQGSGLVSLRYPPPTWRRTETSSPVRTWESLKSPGSVPFIRVQVIIIFLMSMVTKGICLRNSNHTYFLLLKIWWEWLEIRTLKCSNEFHFNHEIW